MAKLALQKNDGDIIKAAEELLLNNGIINGEMESGKLLYIEFNIILICINL